MFDLTVNFHHEHSIVPTNCPWVSEDGSYSKNVDYLSIDLMTTSWMLCFQGTILGSISAALSRSVSSDQGMVRGLISRTAAGNPAYHNPYNYLTFVIFMSYFT